MLDCKLIARVPPFVFTLKRFQADVPKYFQQQATKSSLHRTFLLMLLAFWIPVPPVNLDWFQCTKSRRKKGNISLLILRRCRARLTAYWAPHTPMHEKTPKEGNGQPPKGVRVKKTINVCPRGAGAVHGLHPCRACYPLQQFYFRGSPRATFTRAMLLGVVLNLFASFISLKYC